MQKFSVIADGKIIEVLPWANKVLMKIQTANGENVTSVFMEKETAERLGEILLWVPEGQNRPIPRMREGRS
jgi:hypothetical protein